MTENNFLIKTLDFEGPFSLLLELIQKKKLSINDVSLSEITDEYISFLKETEFKLQDASYFVVVAATLMLIKSRTLLPQLSLTEDEEEDIDELRKKLEYLKEIKNITKKIKDLIYKNVLVIKKQKNKIKIKFRPHKNINLKNILLSLDGLVARSPFKELLPEKKMEKQILLKDVINNINNKIKRFLKINFSEVMMGTSKKDISVSFLAVLELFKNGEIELAQEKSFSEIVIEHKTISITKYKH